MTPATPTPDYPDLICTRTELLRRGFSGAQITKFVQTRQLIRVRRGLYAMPGTSEALLTAVRVGGRLGCVAALATAGVWVRHSGTVHLQMARGASRPRSPQNRFEPLTRYNRGGCELHWRPLSDPDSATEYSVGPIDAMIEAVRCQEPWHAVASLDSALRRGLLRGDQLDVVFFHLPKRLQYLRALVDARCESGLETIFRMILHEAGIPFELQVEIEGVGRVDFVVAGRIVVETDGAEFHGATTAPRDYDRDLALAMQGYTVIRLNYRQVMFEQHRVLQALRAAIASHRMAAA